MAWWNRLPLTAWSLMLEIAVFCNLLFGYGSHRSSIRLFLVLPLAVSLSFFLIADIDSPTWRPDSRTAPKSYEPVPIHSESISRRIRAADRF